MVIRPGLVSRKSKLELASAMKTQMESGKTGIAFGTQKGLAKTAEIQKATAKIMKELAGLGKEPTPTPSPPATPPAPSTPVGKSIPTIEPDTPPQIPMGVFSREASREPTPELAEPEDVEEAGHEAEYILVPEDYEDSEHGSLSRPSEIGDFGGDREEFEISSEGDESTDEWPEDIHAQLQAQLPWDVELPRRPLMGFQPSPAPINDEGNSSFFHTRFLDRGGPRDKVGITGGYMLLRPKHIEIVVERLSFATRQELSNYLHGRFPMGGVINKSYSNTDLPLAVFRHLPGKVTITY